MITRRNMQTESVVLSSSVPTTAPRSKVELQWNSSAKFKTYFGAAWLCILGRTVRAGDFSLTSLFSSDAIDNMAIKNGPSLHPAEYRLCVIGLLLNLLKTDKNRFLECTRTEPNCFGQTRIFYVNCFSGQIWGRVLLYMEKKRQGSCGENGLHGRWHLREQLLCCLHGLQLWMEPKKMCPWASVNSAHLLLPLE